MKLGQTLAIAFTLALAACTTGSEPALETETATSQPAQVPTVETPLAETPKLDRVEKTDDEWRELLTDEQFRVTRRAGTERPWTGEYESEKRSGSFLCVCCNNELFHSKAKYDSGTGWPSFWEPAVSAHIAEHEDRSLLGVRTEVTCARCDAHLGHVFPDGPEPTGLRYCINSAALVLRED